MTVTPSSLPQLLLTVISGNRWGKYQKPIPQTKERWPELGLTQKLCRFGPVPHGKFRSFQQLSAAVTAAHVQCNPLASNGMGMHDALLHSKAHRNLFLLSYCNIPQSLGTTFLPPVSIRSIFFDSTYEIMQRLSLCA